MLYLIDKLMGRTRVTINENERAIWFYKGEVRGILGAGEHVLPNRRNQVRIERIALNSAAFVSVYEKALFEKAADQAEAQLTQYRTGSDEIAVIECDGRIHSVLSPDSKLTVWTDAGPWKADVIALEQDPVIAPALLQRLMKAGVASLLSQVRIVEVDKGQVGLVTVDGRMTGELTPGVTGYWMVGQKVAVKIVDLTRQPLDVTGQELLTRDRVTLRINVAAEYRVVDPVKAVTEVKDFTDALYRALQYAFRKTLGAMTLDQILESQVTVDAEAATKVRSDMAAIGLEVTDITLKDVILPGEMRDILNQVVSAQKAAEANVIKRREETNATRSLLNTAKVMADNPVMLRLKELEALESIAGKVDKLTVTNGTEGLMNDLVKLSGD
ncbi:SPFH domain / Band 7 family protein [Parasphingorhabdus marina DSM 22363]|uniref:SPFH domain / Band 7 family protein n=1 Tax=Parasphingorhabdus marina DSM 22363 TaxID=1123272 RepID=A0A1N6CN97_9SPHN|nr:slipin family protein [Parasphingorhabdus marina]SIN59977.1 SPFH domain / Band 7 family protein [Parasphingorhabdus marina DSM 22363]